MDYTHNWSSVCIKLESVSITSTCYVHKRLENFVLGIPGDLVPWDCMHGGTTRDCPGYPGILSISGSMGFHAWWDYPGLSWMSRDT